MFDVGRLAALVAAALACVRVRYKFGTLVILLVALVDVVSMATPLVLRAHAPANAGYAFVLVYWGPSGMPTPQTSTWLLDVIGAHPIVRVVVTAALSFLAAAIAFRQSAPLRPEHEPARVWDRVGLRFVLVGIFEAMLVVITLLVGKLTAEF
jgi:hypothetical protein